MSDRGLRATAKNRVREIITRLIEFENENLGISSETSLLKTGGLLNETSDSNGRGGKRVGKSGC